MRAIIERLGTVALLASFLGPLAGCGIFIHEKSDDDDDDEEVTEAQPPQSAITEYPKRFEGYVRSAFEVTVDGQAYEDMEAFYTREQERLPERARAAGYDDSWDVRFEAKVGLSDLWKDMRVYVTPVADVGYQAESTVQESGRFSFLLPPEALDKEYRVRANKRISVVLTRDDEMVKICYNFSAVEQQVLFSRDGLPIILDDFKTSLTTYACAVEDSEVEIPDNGRPVEKLKVGMSKSDAVRILGLSGLFVESETRWCWSVTPEREGVCAFDLGDGPCDCYVDLDENDVVVGYENLSQTFAE